MEQLLPESVCTYVRLAGEGHDVATQLTDLILNYGIKKVNSVDNSGVKGDYIVLNHRGLKTNPVFFVGVHKKDGQEVVEIVS